MKIFRYILLIFILTQLAVSPKKADASPDNKKEQYFKLTTSEVQDSKWPALDIKFAVKASPLEAIAIFAAYEHQKNYVPNIIRSKIIKVHSPTEVVVDYEMDLMWPIPNATYSNLHKLSQNEDKSYHLEWSKVTSSTADTVQGSATFFKKNDITLIHYKSLIRPSSPFAGLIESTMLGDVIDTMKAIRDYTEHVKVADKILMEKYKKHITDALNGKNPFVIK